jgi:APA family basic amino acid/polyamine antiporter
MSARTANGGGEHAGLARVLGLLDVIGIVVGSVIGSGIFIVPATVALEARSPVVMLAVWVVGGVLTFFGALCFSELGGMYPQAGGTYVYLREAYGPLVAFLFGWTLFLVIDSGAMATLSSAFATKYLPYFVTLSPLGSRLVTLAFIVFLVTVNYLGVRHGANLQNALAAIKFVAIIAVVGVIFLLGDGSATNFVRPPVGPIDAGFVSRFGAALIASLWAYKGWEAASYSTGELRNPQRNLFLGLLIGCLAVTVLYLATNLAFLWVLPVDRIAASTRIAADALTASVGPAGTSFLSLLILLSILGSANTNILTAPRVYYQMAKDGLFFARAAEVHPRYRTPHLSILAMGAWTVVLAMSGTFEQLLAYVVFGLWIFFGLTVGAVLILRRTRPDIPRPVKVWGFPATPLLFLAATAFIAVSSLITGPRNALAGTAIIALGIPVYAIWRRSGRPRLSP